MIRGKDGRLGNYRMLELKFTIEEMKKLIEQGDAEFLNKDENLALVYQNLYRKENGFYYNVLQRIRMSKGK